MNAIPSSSAGTLTLSTDFGGSTLLLGLKLKEYVQRMGNRDKGLAANSCYVLPWHPNKNILVVTMI